jgi:hypothetical protein
MALREAAERRAAASLPASPTRAKAAAAMRVTLIPSVGGASGQGLRDVIDPGEAEELAVTSDRAAAAAVTMLRDERVAQALSEFRSKRLLAEPSTNA